MLCMRTAHTAQCTGTVLHRREENSSRQLHFKLGKIPISARIVFFNWLLHISAAPAPSAEKLHVQSANRPAPEQYLESGYNECISLFPHLREVYPRLGDAPSPVCSTRLPST